MSKLMQELAELNARSQIMTKRMAAAQLLHDACIIAGDNKAAEVHRHEMHALLDAVLDVGSDSLRLQQRIAMNGLE